MHRILVGTLNGNQSIEKHFFCQMLELPDKRGDEITGRGRLPDGNGQTETEPKNIHKQAATGRNKKVLRGLGRGYIYTTNFHIGWHNKILNSVTFTRTERVLSCEFKLFMGVLDHPFDFLCIFCYFNSTFYILERNGCYTFIYI